MWDDAHCARAIANALRDHARALDEEHATLGIDALDELQLHPIIAKGLEAAGVGVLREQRYPASRSRPKRSEGDRCDLVLTPAQGQSLTDPLMSGTLFAGDGIHPEDALWIEVKAAGQFAMSDGWSRANPLYSGILLTQAMSDVRKLATEPGIAHAALAIIMFNADESLAAHDLSAWYRRCIEKGLPVSAPIAERFPITDRIGNAVATAALIRVHHS